MFMKKTVSVLLAAVLLLSLCACGSAAPSDAQASSGAQLVEKRVSDWSYDYYFQIEKYTYDKDGRLSRTDHTAYQNDLFTDVAYEYGPETYDYYDNGQLRTEYGQGWEKHYDRFGMSIDSPKPAAPFPAILVWYEESIDHEYDSDGNLTRLVADENVYEYRYDDRGRILSVTSTDIFDEQYTFTYDEDGSYTLRGVNRNEGLEGESLKEYDASGRLLRSTSSYDGVSYDERHFFSEDGNVDSVIKTREENGFPEVQSMREIRQIRDSSGQLLREETWDISEAEPRIVEKAEYEYDQYANVTRVQKYVYWEDYPQTPVIQRDEVYTYAYR